jgi:hypothetical protein
MLGYTLRSPCDPTALTWTKKIMIKKFTTFSLSLSLLSFKIKQKIRFIRESSEKSVLPLSHSPEKALFSPEKSPFFVGKSLHFSAGLSLAGLLLTFRRKKVTIFAGLSLSLSAGKSLYFRRKKSPFSPEKVSIFQPDSLSLILFPFLLFPLIARLILMG